MQYPQPDLAALPPNLIWVLSSPHLIWVLLCQPVPQHEQVTLPAQLQRSPQVQVQALQREGVTLQDRAAYAVALLVCTPAQHSGHDGGLSVSARESGPGRGGEGAHANESKVQHFLCALQWKGQRVEAQVTPWSRAREGMSSMRRGLQGAQG